jgi:hypothetical protein
MAELNITSDVASKLIDRVSDALGGVLAPWQTKRIADAEGRAAIIRAQADAQVKQIQSVAAIEVSDLQRRAALRWVAEETRHQANMESITAQAIPLLDEGAKPEGMNDDWMSLFLHECRHTSEAEMQALWAKVLAGEANSPGAFSKRTLATLASLSQAEAFLFRSVCSFMVRLERTYEESPQPIIFDCDDVIYQIEGLSLIPLAGLSGAGLISHTRFQHQMPLSADEQVRGTYFDGEFTLRINPRSASPLYLPMGEVILTPAGEELATICQSGPVAGFLNHLRQTWSDSGVEMDIVRRTSQDEYADDSREDSEDERERW